MLLILGPPVRLLWWIVRIAIERLIGAVMLVAVLLGVGYYLQR